MLRVKMGNFISMTTTAILLPTLPLQVPSPFSVCSNFNSLGIAGKEKEKQGGITAFVSKETTYPFQKSILTVKRQW